MNIARICWNTVGGLPQPQTQSMHLKSLKASCCVSQKFSLYEVPCTRINILTAIEDCASNVNQKPVNHNTDLLVGMHALVTTTANRNAVLFCQLYAKHRFW